MSRYTRSERIFFITQRLLEKPGKITPLANFVKEFKVAKSTVSEDVSIIKHKLEETGEGTLETVSGKHGGVRYYPLQSQGQISEILSKFKNKLAQPERILTGGYLYMADIVSDPGFVKPLSKIFAGYFSYNRPDLVLTIETKGILLAGFTADFLGIPLAVARHDNRVTEGSVITINYMSGSSNKIQSMSLSTRAIPKNSRVLIIDDFMKQGGTLKGLSDLSKEFDSEVTGLGVLLEQGESREKLIKDHLSLGTLSKIDELRGEVTLDMKDSRFLTRTTNIGS